MCRRPPWERRPGATIGPLTRIWPRRRSPSLRPGAAGPASSPGSVTTICEHVSVIPYVPRRQPPAAPPSRAAPAGWDRPEQHGAQAAPLQPGLAQPLELGGNERDERLPSSARRVEALVDHRGGGLAGAAHEDRQPRDVEQRQHAQPAVPRVGAGSRRAAAAAASWLPTVSSTGFGSPVVPDVNSTV